MRFDCIPPEFLSGDETILTSSAGHVPLDDDALAALKGYSFPGHKGRPGHEGGSLPRDESEFFHGTLADNLKSISDEGLKNTYPGNYDFTDAGHVYVAKDLAQAEMFGALVASRSTSKRSGEFAVLKLKLPEQIISALKDDPNYVPKTGPFKGKNPSGNMLYDGVIGPEHIVEVREYALVDGKVSLKGIRKLAADDGEYYLPYFGDTALLGKYSFPGHKGRPGKEGGSLPRFHGTSAVALEDILREGIKPQDYGNWGDKEKQVFVSFDEQVAAAFGYTAARQRGQTDFAVLRVLIPEGTPILSDRHIEQTLAEVKREWIQSFKVFRIGKGADGKEAITQVREKTIKLASAREVFIPVPLGFVEKDYAEFDPTKHPRHPKGSTEGGEFSPKGGEPVVDLKDDSTWRKETPHTSILYHVTTADNADGILNDGFKPGQSSPGSGDDEDLTFGGSFITSSKHKAAIIAEQFSDYETPVAMFTLDVPKADLAKLDIRRDEIDDDGYSWIVRDTLPAKYIKGIAMNDASYKPNKWSGAIGKLPDPKTIDPKDYADFDPNKHPRHPAGSPEGGEFAPGGGIVDVDDATAPKLETLRTEIDKWTSEQAREVGHQAIDEEDDWLMVYRDAAGVLQGIAAAATSGDDDGKGLVVTSIASNQKGVGTKLMQRIFNRAAEKNQYVMLWATPQSRGFYRRLGFQQVNKNIFRMSAAEVQKRRTYAEFDPAEHPRQPPGAPESKGGEFAPAGGEAATAKPPLRAPVITKTARPDERVAIETELAKHNPMVLSRVKYIDVVDEPAFFVAHGGTHPPGRKTLGFFHIGQGRIFINRTAIADYAAKHGKYAPQVMEHTQPMVLRHELGHALYYGSPAGTRKAWERAYTTDPSFDRFTEYSRTNPSEGFAESYMGYISAAGNADNPAYQKVFDRIDHFLGLVRGKAVGGKSVRQK